MLMKRSCCDAARAVFFANMISQKSCVLIFSGKEKTRFRWGNRVLKRIQNQEVNNLLGRSALFQDIPLFVRQSGIFWIARHYSAVGFLDEAHKHADFGSHFRAFDPLQRILSIQTFKEVSLDGTANGQSGFIGQPGPAQPNGIGAGDEVGLTQHAERRNILRNQASDTDHGQRPDPAELMDLRITAEDSAFPDLNVPGDGRMIGNRYPVRNDAIMGHMYERHQQDVASDHRLHEFKGRSVDGHIFPDHGIVSDLRGGADSLIKSVILGICSHKSAKIDAATGADRGILCDFDMRINKAIITNFHIIVDHGIRADFNIISDFCSRSDYRCRMNHLFTDPFFLILIIFFGSTLVFLHDMALYCPGNYNATCYNITRNHAMDNQNKQFSRKKIRFFLHSALFFWILTILTGFQSGILSAEEETKQVPVVPSASGQTVVREASCVLKNGWVYVPSLTLGLKTKIGKAYLRRIEKWELEIFAENGVMTSLRERVPAEVLKLVDSVPAIPKDMPPEFAPPEALYRKLCDKIPFHENIMKLMGSILGNPVGGKALYDIFVMRSAVEYYWIAESGSQTDAPPKWYFSVVTNQDKAIEKMLLKTVPEFWR